MKRNVLVIYLGTNPDTTTEVQKILLKIGKYTKTRLGIHDAVADSNIQTALAVIELAGAKTEMFKEFENELNAVVGVDAKLVSLEL